MISGLSHLEKIFSFLFFLTMHCDDKQVKEEKGEFFFTNKIAEKIPHDSLERCNSYSRLLFFTQ